MKTYNLVSQADPNSDHSRVRRCGGKQYLWKWAMMVACLLYGISCLAQGYSYHPLPTQKQLPVPNVNVIIQSHDGYMWYGTAGGGLCRDDGYQVVTYSSKTTGKGIMESDEITCLAEDQQGHIWLGTRAGLYNLKPTDGSIQRIDNEHVGIKKVNCLGITHDGCIWAGIQQNVVKFSPKGEYLKALSIGDNKREEVKEMMTDSKGTLWLTILRGGIMSIDPKTDHIQKEKWNHSYAAGYILEDTLRQYYWVGTWGGGIVKYPEMKQETATLITTEKQHFGSEVYNMWIDSDQVMWVSTMDDIYAYQIHPPKGKGNPAANSLIPCNTSHLLPTGKKLINKLYPDQQGNIWVPGYSPHTFILAKDKAGSNIHRDEVKTMTEQMGYKIMVNGIEHEGDYFWIYQNRTRLSLYHPATGRLAFMANEALPSPLSTQKPLSRCKTQPGVWTCNGKRLIHAWHEGMTIHWEEIPEALTPNYISSLSDEGNGKLLIGTEKQVLLYDYRKKKLQQLTDSVGIVQQVGYDQQGKLTYTTDVKAPQRITDRQGHVWTLNELTLQELSPKTGARRTLHASDPAIGMDYFTDITLAGDSICLGGIGAYCLIGSCEDLDKPLPDERIIVTHYDTLHSISLSTMNHLHASVIQFAYRLAKTHPWTELPAGENTIDISQAGHGVHTLYVKATDAFGVWHGEQEVFRFSIPLPWYLRWWAWCIYVAIAVLLIRMFLPPKTSPLPIHIEHVTSSSKDSAPQEKTQGDTEEKVEDPFLQMVRGQVQEHLDNPSYGVEDLCRDLGMSRMNLYRKFQSLSALPPSEFIRSHRLQQGCRMLLETGKTVTEIAYDVGFSSGQYFAKCFKDEYGMSPSQWRETKKYSRTSRRRNNS